jgi:hypothetical protein
LLASSPLVFDRGFACVVAVRECDGRIVYGRALRLAL